MDRAGDACRSTSGSNPHVVIPVPQPQPAISSSSSASDFFEEKITRPSSPSGSSHSENNDIGVESADQEATASSRDSLDLSNDRDANHHGPTTEKDPEGLSRCPSAATTVDFPEGGAQGWLVVFGSFCAMFSLYGLINSAAVFESYFAANQLKHHTPSEIGWIFSLYLFIVFFVGVQVGPIFDRFGSRMLVAVGSLLIILSLLLLSWCESESISVVCERTGNQWLTKWHGRVLPDHSHLLRNGGHWRCHAQLPVVWIDCALL